MNQETSAPGVFLLPNWSQIALDELEHKCYYSVQTYGLPPLPKPLFPSPGADKRDPCRLLLFYRRLRPSVLESG